MPFSPNHTLCVNQYTSSSQSRQTNRHHSTAERNTYKVCQSGASAESAHYVTVHCWVNEAKFFLEKVSSTAVASWVFVFVVSKETDCMLLPFPFVITTSYLVFIVRQVKGASGQSLSFSQKLQCAMFRSLLWACLVSIQYNKQTNKKKN